MDTIDPKNPANMIGDCEMGFSEHVTDLAIYAGGGSNIEVLSKAYNPTHYPYAISDEGLKNIQSANILSK
jgi:hypothetical protein